MEKQSVGPTPEGHRQDRRIHEDVHGPDKSIREVPEPAVCPQCGAVYYQGRWTWIKRPVHAHEEMCPACHRVRDRYPAGFLTLSGRFLQQHTEEILNGVRHEEQKENAEHPLHRVMQTEEGTDGIIITTTDLHLPRRIAEALQHAYQGEIGLHYSTDGTIVRMHWTRVE